jgi:hypothetical protein
MEMAIMKPQAVKKQTQESLVCRVEYQRLNRLEQFFVPFARSAGALDDEARIVEGWVYSQSRVKSDRWELPYETLVRSIPAYMEMPAVRSMHRADLASGVALEMTPDDAKRRVFVRAKVVDDQEWRKCKEGVYRGFSLGGKPELARGSKIEEFTLLEISLVDRPADTGARFTLVRAATGSEEYVVQVISGTDARAEAVARLIAEKRSLMASIQDPAQLARQDTADRDKLTCRLIRIDMDLRSYGVSV